jgi:hypothetical protein
MMRGYFDFGGMKSSLYAIRSFTLVWYPNLPLSFTYANPHHFAAMRVLLQFLTVERSEIMAIET